MKLGNQQGCARYRSATRGWPGWLERAAVAAGALAVALGCGAEPDAARATPELALAGNVPAQAKLSALIRPIVFRSDRDREGIMDLYVMQPDGGDVRRLTEGGDYFFPEWSPSGDSIAFRSNVNGLNAEVGLISTDDGPPVVLTQGELGRSWFLPVNWSLDGQLLSYASFSDSSEAHADLWVIPRTGGPREPLFPDLQGEYNVAAWSWPDASKVAYIDIVDAVNADVWIASADASDPVNLTQGRVYAPEYPQWSPDGTRIAISAFWLLPDGTIEGLGEVDGVFMVPDKEVFVFDVETGAMTRVTDNAFEDDMPAWSPDGQSLLVASDRDGDFDIWRIPLDAPDQAQNLIDDADLPREDSMPDAYWGPS